MAKPCRTALPIVIVILLTTKREILRSVLRFVPLTYGSTGHLRPFGSVYSVAIKTSTRSARRTSATSVLKPWRHEVTDNVPLAAAHCGAMREGLYGLPPHKIDGIETMPPATLA